MLQIIDCMNDYLFKVSNRILLQAYEWLDKPLTADDFISCCFKEKLNDKEPIHAT